MENNKNINKVVAIYGAFNDLEHYHIECISKAREIAGPKGKVIIGLSTDDFNNKKYRFNLESFKERKASLENIKSIDLIFEENDVYQKMQDIEVHKITDVVEIVYSQRAPLISSAYNNTSVKVHFYYCNKFSWNAIEHSIFKLVPQDKKNDNYNNSAIDKILNKNNHEKVLAVGYFNYIEPIHISFIEEAKKFAGDKGEVIVGLFTDELVQSWGINENSYEKRKDFLTNFKNLKSILPLNEAIPDIELVNEINCSLIVFMVSSINEREMIENLIKKMYKSTIPFKREYFFIKRYPWDTINKIELKVRVGSYDEQ